MNTRSICAFGAGVAVATSIALLVAVGPDHGDHEHHDGPDGDMGHEMSPEDMMAAYMALGNPGEHHEEMKRFEGNWTAVTAFSMDPSNPDEKTMGTATATTKSIMGGRYSVTDFKSDFMGMPFEGIAYSGYDNARNEHVSIWMDSMSTAIMNMKGQINEDGNLVMQGTAFAPGMGDYQMKMVYHWEDDDHWSQNFYDQMPDGSWFNSGTMTYTRE